MSDLLQSHLLMCPYCGEVISVLVDCSVTEQSYIEDCEVCCRPIQLRVLVSDEGAAQVTAAHENE